MASMQDIADRAGVSRATVSRVLSGHPSVKASTRMKVMRWVDELGYEPDVIAQSLAGGSTNLVGVVLPEIAYPFFSEILEAMEDQAFVHGRSIDVPTMLKDRTLWNGPAMLSPDINIMLQRII